MCGLAYAVAIHAIAIHILTQVIRLAFLALRYLGHCWRRIHSKDKDNKMFVYDYKVE